MAVGFRYPFQKIFRFSVERQQPPSLEDIPAADMKIGPRQGDKFTLPQAAGESCVDERECAKFLCCSQVSLDLPQAQGSSLIFLCLRFLAEPYRIIGDALVTGRFIHTAPQEQMDAPDASGAESPASQVIIETGNGVFGQFCQ